LIDEAEGPGEWRAALFEPEVLPLRLAWVKMRKIRTETAVMTKKACEPHLGT